MTVHRRWHAVWLQPGLSREVSAAVDEDWEDAPDAPLAALRLATAKLSVSDAAEGASPDGKKRWVPASPGSQGLALLERAAGAVMCRRCGPLGQQAWQAAGRCHC
jgi:hypothetical protein